MPYFALFSLFLNALLKGTFHPLLGILALLFCITPLARSSPRFHSRENTSVTEGSTSGLVAHGTWELSLNKTESIVSRTPVLNPHIKSKFLFPVLTHFPLKWLGEVILYQALCDHVLYSHNLCDWQGMLLDKFLVCYRKINESVIADNDMDLCFTFSQKCCLCTGKFKTFSATQKHAERKHTVEGDRVVNVLFLDNEENEASVPEIGFLNRRSQDFKIG